MQLSQLADCRSQDGQRKKEEGKIRTIEQCASLRLNTVERLTDRKDQGIRRHDDR